MSTTAGIADSICAIILFLAGCMKLGNLRAFGQQIIAYQVVPSHLARLAGYALPPLEVTLAALIIFIPRLAVASAVLFISFALAISVNIQRGRTELHCGCFGPTRTPQPPRQFRLPKPP